MGFACQFVRERTRLRSYDQLFGWRHLECYITQPWSTLARSRLLCGVTGSHGTAEDVRTGPGNASFMVNTLHLWSTSGFLSGDAAFHWRISQGRHEQLRVASKFRSSGAAMKLWSEKTLNDVNGNRRFWVSMVPRRRSCRNELW